MQTMLEKIKTLEKSVIELNICNERIEELTKERSRLDKSMIACIVKLNLIVKELDVFK